MVYRLEMRLWALSLALLACGATWTSAQTPLVPTKIWKSVADGNSPDKQKIVDKVTVPVVLGQHPNVDRDEHPVGALTRIYQSGNGRMLNRLAIEIIRTVSCEKAFFDLPSTAGAPCPRDSSRRGLDIARDYVALVWTGADFSGKRVVYRIIVRQGLTDPYNVTLPGLKSNSNRAIVYELFLSPDETAEHASQYVFSPQPDPIEAQIPSFVAAATGPLFASLARLTGTFDLGRVSKEIQTLMQNEEKVLKLPPPQPTVTAQLATFTPPTDRSKVKVADTVRQAVPVAEFMKQTKELASRLDFVDARDAKCAQSLASRLVDVSNTTAGNTACIAATTTDQMCRAEFDKVFRSEVNTATASCPETVQKETRNENEARPPERRMDATQLQAETTKRLEQNQKLIQQVDGEFRKLVASQQPERLTGEGTFSNTPLTHWSFGALTSFALKASSRRPRVKVGNDGKLAADPLGRQMTLVVVNFAPRGYDPEQRPMSMSERVRPFVGVVASPDFGVGGGLSVGMWRGVGLNFGAALTFVPSLRGGDEIGSSPSDPNDSFGAARATAVFVGASYNFK